MKIKELQTILDRWFFQRRYRILLFILIAIMLFAANFIPYINLISNTYLILLILLVLVPLILDIDEKIFITFGLTLFVFAFFIWFLGQTEETESLTDYIYIFFLSGSLKALFSFKRTQNKI